MLLLVKCFFNQVFAVKTEPNKKKRKFYETNVTSTWRDSQAFDIYLYCKCSCSSIRVSTEK